MIVCRGYDKRVYWLHDDDSIKELAEYINDDTVIVVDKDVSFLPIPNDGYEYRQMWDEDKEEIYLKKMGKIKLPQYELTEKTSEIVETTSFDNLINMDMLLAIDEKLNIIMGHLGIEQ